MAAATKGEIASMHTQKHRDEPPKAHRVESRSRAHRLDIVSLSHCTLSDCCGAPVMQGGICFDCRERCEDDSPVVPERDEDCCEVFDEVTVTSRAA